MPGSIVLKRDAVRGLGASTFFFLGAAFFFLGAMSDDSSAVERDATSTTSPVLVSTWVSTGSTTGGLDHRGLDDRFELGDVRAVAAVLRHHGLAVGGVDAELAVADDRARR